MRALVIAVLALCYAGVAQAQPISETWVSGFGDDANPCTRTAPCQTYAGALALTAPGGMIHTLDPGEYGSVTINKAVTIDGRNGLGRVQVAAMDGITVAAGVNDVVMLRGITLEGDRTGNGIQFVSGALLEIDRCVISKFNRGINFVPAVGSHLMVNRVTTKENANAGVRVGTTVSGVALVTVARTVSERNEHGYEALAGARLSIFDSVASRNSSHGVFALAGTADSVTSVNLEEMAITGNPIGVHAQVTSTGSAIVRMSKVLATGNTTATMTNGTGAEVLTFGNNRLEVAASIALSATAPSQTVNFGQAAQYVVGVAPSGLFADPIALACSGLPAGASCEVLPATVPGSASSMVTVTIKTLPGMMGRRTPRGLPTVGLAALFLVALAGRKRRMLMLFLLLLALAPAISACNNTPGEAGDMAHPSSPDFSGEPVPIPPGSYPFTVTATSGAVTASLPLTLIVN